MFKTHQEAPIKRDGIDFNQLKCLIKQRNDTSRYGVLTYRKVYSEMMDKKQWNYKRGGYKRSHMSDPAKKLDIVKDSKDLICLFNETVYKLLGETVK